LPQVGQKEQISAANHYYTSVIVLTDSNSSLRATPISAAGLLW